MERLDLIWQVIERVETMGILNTPGRRLSVSRVRKNLMHGSMWQGMKTRHGDGTEALSEEMESNGSATPKSRRHPLTLPPDAGESAQISNSFLRLSIFPVGRRSAARPSAGNANRWLLSLKYKS